MKITYENYKYDELRDLKLKLFLPDDGNAEQYVIALHGFAGDMESTAIHALAVNLMRRKTAVLAFNYAGHGSDDQDALFSLARCLSDFQYASAYAQQRFPGAEWSGVFATSFGGFITLNSLALIPDSVSVVLRAPAVNMSDVFARIVESTAGGMAGFERSGSVQLGYEHKLNVPYSFFQELCSHDVFNQTFERGMLLISGTADNVVLPEDTAAFCKRNPCIVHREIKDAGHRLLKPEEYAELMQYACPYLMENHKHSCPEKQSCVYEAGEDQRVCSSCMFWGTERGYSNTIYGDYAVYGHDSVCLHPEQFGKPIASRFGCEFWTKACRSCAADSIYETLCDGWG